MEKQTEKRSTDFRWHSRQELYEYFRKNFDLSKEEVDKEIGEVMAVFKPRKGYAIETAELWQKVGLNLESKNTHKLKVEHLE